MLKAPVRKMWISKDWKGHGYNAIDCGWFDADPSMPDDTGRNPLLYAMGEGTVLSVDNSKSDTPDYKTYGNTIVIRYDCGYTSLYAHIKKDSFLVKAGDRVGELQPVCRMGNSGNSYGNHLHLEICEGATFRSHGGVNPLDVMEVTDWHIVDPDTAAAYDIRHQIVVPVPEDTEKDQVEVTIMNLRVRKEPSLSAEILGFADMGFYYSLERVEADGYKWDRVADGMWIAETDGSKFHSSELEKLRKEVERLRSILAGIELECASALDER